MKRDDQRGTRLCPLGAMTAAQSAAPCTPSGGLTFICGVANPGRPCARPQHALDHCQRHGTWQWTARGRHAREDGEEPVCGGTARCQPIVKDAMCLARPDPKQGRGLTV